MTTDPQPIIVFIDETYLLMESGFIQSAIPLPAETYHNEIVPLCQHLLTSLDPNAKEFKGSKITRGNFKKYLQFLQYFANAAANIGDQVELRPIVAIDAQAPFTGDNFDIVFGQVTTVLKNLGIVNENHIAAEFSRQVLWLLHHWTKIASVRYRSPLVLQFDNKHRYAQQFSEYRFVHSPQLGAAVLVELANTMTLLAEKLFTMALPRIPIPRIARFDFRPSQAEFGLQAADLFSHLFYNAIKCEMGVTEENVELKYELFLHAVPDFGLEASLTTNLLVDKNTDGKSGLRCVNPQLLSTFQLMPA